MVRISDDPDDLLWFCSFCRTQKLACLSHSVFKVVIACMQAEELTHFWGQQSLLKPTLQVRITLVSCGLGPSIMMQNPKLLLEFRYAHVIALLARFKYVHSITFVVHCTKATS